MESSSASSLPEPRRADRLPWQGPAQVRGACGAFRAVAEDVSLAGVRLSLEPEDLHLASDADLATASAAVQTRLGSRFVVELGSAYPRLARKARLVRLVLPAGRRERLDLGCAFEEALTCEALSALGLRVSPADGSSASVRRVNTWAEEGRSGFDPEIVAEKVESLFDVPGAAIQGADQRAARSDLRVLLSPREGHGAQPLLCSVRSVSPGTLLLRPLHDGSDVRQAQEDDLDSLAQAVSATYGEWPAMEVVAGAQRMWHGRGRVCGVELGVQHEVLLRVAFGRRLRDAEVARLCAR